MLGLCDNPLVDTEYIYWIAHDLQPHYEDYSASYESCQEFVFRLADEIMNVSLGIQSTSVKSLMICFPFVIINLTLFYFNVDFAWK